MKRIKTSQFQKNANAKLETLIDRKINQLLTKKLLNMNGDFKKMYLQMSRNNFTRAFKEFNFFNQNDAQSTHIPQSFKSNSSQMMMDFTKILAQGIFKNF
jgi:hypothetical protein